jgi:hypothetical protein
MRMSFITLLQVQFSSVDRTVVRMSYTTLLQVQFSSVDRTVVRMSYTTSTIFEHRQDSCESHVYAV